MSLFNFKNLAELSGLVSVALVGTTAVSKNLISAAAHGSKALDNLAADADDATEKSGNLNKLKRQKRYDVEYQDYNLPKELTEAAA